MTLTEKKAFKKLREFTLLVRNRAPVGTLRMDGVAMTDLVDEVLKKPEKRRKLMIGNGTVLGSYLKREWETT